jgi:geranylgeranyl reductase family protein
VDKYDIIVVGAGASGCLSSISASDRKCKVLMLETKNFEKIGEKVCGDAISSGHFDAVGLSPPKNIIKNNVDNISIYSPSGKYSYNVEGAGFALDRFKFGRWLLNEALDRGIELKHDTKVLSPILEEKKTKGVKAMNTKTGEVQKFFGKIIIDASGWTGALRKDLPPLSGFVNRPIWGDVAVCYREIRELKKTIDVPDFHRIYVDMKIAPGGYWWFFPQSAEVVNIGLGVQGGCGYDPKHIFKERLSKLPILENSKVIHGGGGVVPVRRSLHSLVVHDIIIVGDAGFTANPIHGGGIGSSMRAGKIAGEKAAESIEKNVPEILWEINMDYVLQYGMKAAGLEIFKIFLQGLNNADIEFGMKNQLITENDLTRVGVGSGDLTIRDKAKRILKGIRRPGVLSHLATAARYMRKIKELYSEYPDKANYERWSSNVMDTFSEFKERIH